MHHRHLQFYACTEGQPLKIMFILCCRHLSPALLLLLPVRHHEGMSARLLEYAVDRQLAAEEHVDTVLPSQPS